MFGTSHRNIPIWLENNILFRRLFILRKLLFTRNRFSHYSGAGEDVSIARIFHNINYGFYVDVGCYHPIKFNNTRMLYRRGWRGINIDIDAIKIEMFNLVRSQDTNIQCAVSANNGMATFYKQGFFSQISSLDPATAGVRSRMQVVECRTLTSIIDGTEYKDKKIDLLSVDAEGYDLEVLRSLDFLRYAPSLVVVETHDKVFGVVEQSALYGFLKEMGYELVGWCGESLLMADREMQSRLIHGAST